MVLTEKQKKLLAFYNNKKNWRRPTLKQMREFMGVTSDQTIIEHLAAIKRKGFL